VTRPVYYKATRPDGTDFYSGTVLYEPARRVRPRAPEQGERLRLCGPGVLHAATVPTETLIGGSWPCRLFTVTGRPVFTDPGHPHKVGFQELKVLEELEAWRVFGPQGQQVVSLIDRAATLTGNDIRALAAARDAAWDAARDAAWDAAGAAAWDAAGAVVTWDLAAVTGRPYTTAQRDLLIRPWADTIGLPEGLPK